MCTKFIFYHHLVPDQHNTTNTTIVHRLEGRSQNKNSPWVVAEAEQGGAGVGIAEAEEGGDGVGNQHYSRKLNSQKIHVHTDQNFYANMRKFNEHTAVSWLRICNRILSSWRKLRMSTNLASSIAVVSQTKNIYKMLLCIIKYIRSIW